MKVPKAPWLTLLAALGAGCASRAVPDHFPAGSAASPKAPAAKPARVNRALTELPLPGEPGAELFEPVGSSNLKDAAPAQHTGHHHGH